MYTYQIHLDVIIITYNCNYSTKKQLASQKGLIIVIVFDYCVCYVIFLFVDLSFSY